MTAKSISFFALVVACGGGGPPAPAPAEAPPAPEAAPEAPKPAAEASAPSVSAIHIDGVRITDVTGEELAVALKKRGWDSQANPETHVGKYEQLGLGARKGNGEVATVTISRVAKTPKPITDGSSESDFAPKALQANYANTEKVAQKYDPDGDALISIMYVKGGSTAAAEALLDAILNAPK